MLVVFAIKLAIQKNIVASQKLVTYLQNLLIINVSGLPVKITKCSSHGEDNGR